MFRLASQYLGVASKPAAKFAFLKTTALVQKVTGLILSGTELPSTVFDEVRPSRHR